MRMVIIRDANNTVSDLLADAEAEGLLVKTDDAKHFALLPLDDDLIDFLMERNPRFIAECAEIRREIQQGRYHTHADVEKLLSEGGAENGDG